MRFIPLSETEEKEAGLRFVPLEAEPAPQAGPVVSPEELPVPPGAYVSPAGAAFVPPRVGRRPPEGRTAAPPLIGQPQPEYPPRGPVAVTPVTPAAAAVPEMRPYEPSLWQRFLDLIPGDRAKAANEAMARRIAREEKIPVEEAYRRMREAVGVRGIFGTRPSGQPMFNPEGRAPIRATTEAAPFVAEGILDIPRGMAESALRAFRAGDIEKSVDSGFIDRAITYLGDESKDFFIPNLPERLGVRRDDPNYQGFMGLGKSLGYSLTTLVASATTGTAATLATGNPLVGVGAGMATSGTLAYRASKDDFLDRLREKLNKDSKRVFNQPLSQEAWDKAKKEFNSAAVEYGAWEAIPEAISNAIFLKAFGKPVTGARGSRLAGYLEKATSFAAENLTETATGMGQNAAELKAGLTEDEITIADAFKQQFIQTAITMGVMGGGMKGKQLAAQFYNERVLPRVDPASALAKAIKADIDAVAFNPQAIKQEAAAAASGQLPRTLQELARQRQVAPVPPSGEEPPEQPPVAAPERVEPTIGEPSGVAADRVEAELGEPPGEPAGRVEPALGEPPSEPGGRVEPTLMFVPLSEEPGGRVEPTLGEGPVAEGPVRRFEPLAERAPGQVQAIPGMPTGAELAEPEPTVTPVTPPTGEATTVPVLNTLLQQANQWDQRNRRDRSGAWFDGGKADDDARAGFAAAAQNGGDTLPSHGMSKESTLSGGVNNLLNLLQNGLDPKRGSGRLDYAPLVTRPGSAAAAVSTTPGGSAYSDGPFILVARPGREFEGKLEGVGAILVNQAHPEIVPALRAAVQAIRPDILVEPFSNAGEVAKRLTESVSVPKAAEAPETVTPVTPAAEAAPEAPTVTFRPTPAAAALPDTPTVAPFTTPQIFEPPPVGLEADEWPSINVPVADLKLSKDVPQFKLGADVRGVVEPLGGTFDKRGVAPIQVWRRLDGSLEVISGRHRFDLAQRSGTKLIAAQIYDEAAGFDKLHAAILDAELNIRDGQGKVKDYVNYFKESGIDRDTAESKGLLARATGKRSYTIANQGSDELIAAVRSDQIGDEAAYYVALNAPGDARLQSVGIKAIMDGKSMNTATNMMQAVKALAGENDTTVDMFGFDDSAMREAEEMAKIAAQKQREIQARLSAISGASKNPKLAAEEGIDIRNPEEVKRRIDELRQKKSAWDNWSTNSDLVAEIRAARGVAPPPVTAPPPAPAPAPALELTAPTPQELRTQEEGREQAEEKAIVDREVDLFQLQPQVAEREAPPEADLFAGEAAPSAEYQAALEKSRRAGEAFRKVQEAYRKQQISDEDFLAGRREYDRAMAEFDRATRKERGEPEPVAEPTVEPGSAPDENDTGFRGASDEEVGEVADAFKAVKTTQDEDKTTRVFDPPAKSDVVRIEDKVRIFTKDAGYLTVEQAKQRIEQWKQNAQSQGEDRRNAEKIVLSLFDMTGEWSKPWEEAGYQVYRFDIQTDPEFGDVNRFSSEFFNDIYGAFEGQDVYAILAACPCTDFASSGARHFAAKDADGRTIESVQLVQQTLATIEYFKPSVWAIENPVGRIEKLTSLPPWRMSFNPNHFGDPYTKKTLLWGRFNANLPVAPVEPTEGSKMHRMYGGKSQETKNARSVTPEGFAYAFFQANNAIDNPVMAIANKYDMMDPGVFREALAAGMSEKQISDIVDDPYYFSLDYRGAEASLMAAVQEMGAAPATDAQIKNETEFLQETTQNALEAIQEDFMVGDLVRFGNTPGVVIGLEGDYARFRPDGARSPKAYQRVPKKSLTFVSRPDTTSEVSYSKEQDNKFGDEAGQLNADKSNLIRLLGANMYQSSLSDVAIKELLQNAFDAVKGATASVNAEGKKIKPIYKTGNIEITIDRENRTISVKDDARGMTPDIVRKAFFTIAGSDKSDLPPELRSGGLGLAKMGFMLGSETLQLDTVRDGVRVTVDASAADIASDNFKIKKAPAPKGEHGTTVTVKIPENYIDPKTGDPKPIYFPYSLKSVDAFEKPLVGPVELKVTLKGYGGEETSVLPVGINFPQDKYTKFKANFDWGSADIYFSVARSEGRSWSIKHQVLSSGVYQFSPDFTLDNEKIPYDIIVDVKPNVDARHPDYPFENSRERFKGRLEKDVEALTMYLGQIARGYEARDLQESFKGVVSMPRVEAGAEIAGIAEKLKKTFGTQAAAKPAELKPLPKEITVTADSVTDTKTQQILVDVKAKEAEKKKEATFKGEAAPKALDFMIELKQDPKLPVFHNNTNVDFLAIGRPYGEPEKFFAELGTLLVEMKEEMAKSGMYGYEKLAPENLFFAGVSIDKQYGGVHIKVPYKAVFINPFYSFGARTLFGARQQLLNTMIHEIAHTGSMDHGVAHNTNMVKVEQYLSDEGLLDYYRDALLDILRRHESAFTAMREAYGQSTTRNTAKSLEDYGKDAAAASAGGDRGGAEYAPSAVSARGRPERGEGVPEAEAAGREGAVGRGAGEPAVIEVDGVSRPTTNNRGQRIHPTDEGLRNFWRWFGDSQVVDSQGRPLVVYHGTGFTQAGDAITTFQISAGLYGAGAYFSGNPERAASYARAGQGTIYPVYVRLVNPISIDGYIERFEGTTRSADRAWDARQELLNDGVDGVLSEPRGPTRFWEVVAFNENQIKSAVGNLGTFSPTSPSILENIEPMAEPSLAEQEGDLIFGREALREYQIKEYAKLRRELGKVPKKVAAGEAGIDMQRNVTRLMQAARELQASIRGLKLRRDSAEVFLAKALTEYDAGNLERDVLDVIQTAYQRAPELLEGLLLQVRSPAKPGISRSAGDFNPWKRAITLYKGTSGVTEAATIRHELAHTLEQMMTPEQRMAVVQAWGKALQRAIKQNPDELHQRYFKAILDFLDNPTERRLRAAQSALPSYDMYQFINPSEFWAVNAEKLMAAELGSAWDKFKRAMRKMLEGIKKVLGFDNRYDVHKAFNQVMGGSKERITDGVLVDMVKGTGGDFILLSNIEDDKKLVQKYNRPNTPMLDTSPIKTFITKQFQNGKEFLQDVAENPREAMAGKGDSVIDGLIYLRNKNVWYGSGLEARDFDKYNGELTTAEGVATASVALDNAIRSGNIGVEVIFRGGIEYDPKSNNFVAVRRNLGMKGVYEAEAKMKRKLGNQLGTDIIQGYLEAKRSISIMDELYDRGAAYEAAKDNLQAMKDMGADADQIAQAKDAAEALAKELEAIKKAASSVNMSEEEMYEFASLDEKHPELRDLMDNWTAINQNLLKFWRQVGLLSQGRYETLSAIKDYVPWYRIMEDELDLHDADQSAVQSTTRSMTNIGREKLFKRGKPLAVVDFRAQAGQKDFKIQPSSVVKVEVNGDPVDSDLVTVTPTGEVRLDMDLQDNDLVVFTTNREIQNIIDNMTRNVMRMTMNGIRQFAANRIVLEYASRDAKNKIMVFPSVDKEKGRFNWIVNGKKVVVEIQDPLVAASIYGMENLNLRMWAPLAAVANLTRRTITLSGVFQIKQVFKDAPTAAIVTGVKNPLALIGGVWKGFLTSLTNTDPAVDILKAAGIGGFMSPARTPEAEIKRRLGIMNRNVFSAVIKGLDHIGDSSDMAQRVATYKRVLAETGDETQALYQAANVINFLHHGSAGYAQAVVKVVPFMGAYANAMDVLVRALVGGGLKGMSRKKALARLAITMSLLTGATLLYAMLAGGDPEYDELDDQTKLKNIIIPGTKIMLPMNTSAAYFFKAIPELIYNAVTREGTENEMDRRRIRKALADSARDMLLGPEPLPAGVKPVLEVAINHDFFTGRPVIPEGLKDVAAAEQYTASTSELGKKISAMLEIPGTDGKRVISPIEADHLVRGIFGTAGAMGQWVSNSIGTIAETRPEPTAREMPITGSFLRDEVPRGREDLFYDFKEVVFEKYKTWQKMVDREDFEGADKYIEKHGDVAAMYEYINETEAELKEINSEIRRLGETRSKDESPKERRQQIDDYKRLRQEILEPVKELRREVLR